MLFAEKHTVQNASEYRNADDRPEVCLLYIRPSETLRRAAASVSWTGYGQRGTWRARWQGGPCYFLAFISISLTFTTSIPSFSEIVISSIPIESNIITDADWSFSFSARSFSFSARSFSAWASASASRATACFIDSSATFTDASAFSMASAIELFSMRIASQYFS